MTLKYLYLDDEDAERLLPLTEAVQSEGNLKIDIEHPAHYLEIDSLLQKLQEYDGVILDWRLNSVASSKGNSRFPFRAGALAQEIRTRQTETEVKAIPIVLWSTQERLTKSFFEDDTAHDLFDIRQDKIDISEKPKRVFIELSALYQGYKDIKDFLDSQSANNPERLLKTSKNYIDIRALHRLSAQTPTHEHARFILNELISRPGLLIDEELLAAKLGVDKEKSPHWNKLLEIISAECEYQGPFKKGWPRWWANCILRVWWKSLSDDLDPLSRLGAAERVKIIKETTKLSDLTPADPIEPYYRDKFFTICEFYRKPLDPLDGVIIDEKEPEPWQDRRYISLEVALDRKGEEKRLYPHPTERERLKELREKRSQ